MKALTLFKNSVISALSTLQELSVSQQVYAKDLSVQANDDHQKGARDAESDSQNNIDEITRPSKRPRISEPEPPRGTPSIEVHLLKMLHDVLGLRELAGYRDLSQIVQMNL